jgi:hypothetical protein
MPPHVSTEHLARNWAELQRRAGKDELTIAKQNKFMLATGVTHRPLSLACFHEGSESGKERFLGKPVGEVGGSSYPRKLSPVLVKRFTTKSLGKRCQRSQILLY